MYANKYWLTNLLDYEELQKRYTIWVAQYSDNCTYKGKYDMWQKSSSGKIEGINGYVDLDEMFRDLITVNKVGPKTAINLLSLYSREEIINYITSGRVRDLTRESKCGTKYNRI